jgi:hypothetical protein
MAVVHRALARKIGLLTAAVGCIALGLAMWTIPSAWFDAGDRVAGGGLIACGVLFVVLALWLGSGRTPGDDASTPDEP